MKKLNHLEALRLLREDPRFIGRSIDRARQLRAEVYAEAWRRLRDLTRRLIGAAAARRRKTVDHSERRAQA